MNPRWIAAPFAATITFASATASAQSAPTAPPRRCSDDGLGRHSRFVGRMDYGPRWYVQPSGLASAFDFSFGGGYWIAATSGCEEWHLRIQPEAFLDVSIFDRDPVEVRGHGGVAIGAASMLVQLSYFAGGGYGGARAGRCFYTGRGSKRSSARSESSCSTGIFPARRAICTRSRCTGWSTCTRRSRCSRASRGGRDNHRSGACVTYLQ